VVISTTVPIIHIAIPTAIVPRIIPTAKVPGIEPIARVPETVPTVPPRTVVPGIIPPAVPPRTVVPRRVPTAVIKRTVPAAVIPGVIPCVKAAPAPVVVILVNIIAHVDNHLVGTRDLDARFRVVKPNDSIGILVLFIIVDIALFIQSGGIIGAAAVVLVNIPAVRDHLHPGSFSLHDHHLFLGWLLLLFGLRLPLLTRSGWIRVDIIPLLGET
jgi:protein-S-isoprenylcysteine O-methyltransferase Ste14